MSFAYLFKVIMVGNSGVGKSSLLLRFTDQRFKEVSTTIGVEFGARIIPVEDRPVKVQVWDTAGQEAFRSITRSYYRGSAGAILAFDLQNEESFRALQTWYEEARENCQPHLQVVVVGCKCDLPNRKVTAEQAASFAAQHDLDYIEASALTGFNVDKVFETLCKKIYRLLQADRIDITNESNGIKLGPLHAAGPAVGEQAAKAEGGGCC